MITKIKDEFGDVYFIKDEQEGVLLFRKEEIPSVIMKYRHKRKMEIKKVRECDVEFVINYGAVFSCRNKALLQELSPVMAPLLQGRVEPTEPTFLSDEEIDEFLLGGMGNG